MNLKESRTKYNLMEAFVGESQAYTKYMLYSGVAEEEEYIQISNIFAETAGNEKEHAEIFLKYLTDNGLNSTLMPVNSKYPIAIGNTKDNLKYASYGEDTEANKTYLHFAKIAREEGFEYIAKSFDEIAKIEKHHNERFEKLLDNMEKNQVFKKSHKVQWKCDVCGYIVISEEAPLKCPVCHHKQGFFEIRCENY